MHLLDKALKHEQYFEALTGLRINEFQRLVEEVKEDWKQARIDRLTKLKSSCSRNTKEGAGFGIWTN